MPPCGSGTGGAAGASPWRSPPSSLGFPRSPATSCLHSSRGGFRLPGPCCPSSRAHPRAALPVTASTKQGQSHGGRCDSPAGFCRSRAPRLDAAAPATLSPGRRRSVNIRRHGRCPRRSLCDWPAACGDGQAGDMRFLNRQCLLPADGDQLREHRAGPGWPRRKCSHRETLTKLPAPQSAHAQAIASRGPSQRITGPCHR